MSSTSRVNRTDEPHGIERGWDILVDMRELVYLSEAKLRQFTADRTGRRGRGRDLEGEIKTPLGGFKIGRAADTAPATPDLDTVLDELERSPRAPKWFEDETVRPGQWVHFECPINYWIMPREHFSSVVLFLSAPFREMANTLLLHGSAHHLIGPPPAAREMSFDLNRTIDGSGPGVFLSIKDEQGSRNLREGAEALGRLQDDDHSPAPMHDGYDEAMRAVVWNVGIIGGPVRNAGLRTAAWMSGYARVSGRFPDAPFPWQGLITVATPLYVEYIDPPMDT